MRTKLQKILFGKTSEIEVPNCRSYDLKIPSNGEEGERCITYMADDGLILYFIRRIEKLEERVSKLESKKSKK